MLKYGVSMLAGEHAEDTALQSLGVRDSFLVLLKEICKLNPDAKVDLNLDKNGFYMCYIISPENSHR